MAHLYTASRGIMASHNHHLGKRRLEQVIYVKRLKREIGSLIFFPLSPALPTHHYYYLPWKGFLGATIPGYLFVYCTVQLVPLFVKGLRVEAQSYRSNDDVISTGLQHELGDYDEST